MSEYKVKAPRKLIEVALPLKEINEACAHEKMPGIGPHPRGIHLWWARRPLAAARAVLFAQLVNDPGWDEELQIGYKRKADANRKREELFEIIRELVKWENTNNEIVLEKARAEIRKSWKVTCDLNKDHPQAAELFNPDKLPAFHDPFAGGGSIPLEAQRLGLEAWASDLNPVAVLINKAMIEIPPKFVGHRPIGPIPKRDDQTTTNNYTWPGLTGLAEDVRRWGHWVREEAYKRIGHLYPPIEITTEMVAERPDLAPYRGKKLSVIAYIWVRTVKSPNPQFSHVDVPLSSTFLLSDKKGKEAWVEPVVLGDKYEFKVHIGTPTDIEKIKKGTKAAGRTSNFYCLFSHTPIDSSYIKAEGINDRFGKKLMAIVLSGKSERVYISPISDQEALADSAHVEINEATYLPTNRVDYATPAYGMKTIESLFTTRQYLSLSTISNIVSSAHGEIYKNAKSVMNAILDNDINDYAKQYANAVITYMAFALDRCSDFSNSCCRWVPGNQKIMNLFNKQAISMTWDFAETAILNDVVGGYAPAIEYISECIKKVGASESGHAVQSDARSSNVLYDKIVSTDPPYYDNIGYADLSDFFYLWLRKTLRTIYPDLLSTLSTPKLDELIVTPGNNKKSQNYKDDKFYQNGMIETFTNISSHACTSFPITFYYAFKQSESTEIGDSSRGWSVFLDAMIQSGLAILGTWPMRSEQEYRMRSLDSNALASSIILVSRKRSSEAAITSRKEFVQELSKTFPEALDNMINGSETSSPVAPVDLAQAAIGPGMAIYSKYNAILESDGSQMSVHTALILINKALDEYFKEREGDWDGDTNFCLQWFNEYGWREGVYGDADVLARAKGVSVEGVRDSGVLAAAGGKVKLLRPIEYPDSWNPAKDSRMPVWEVLHHLIRLHQTRGESAAAEIVKAIPHISETARQLAFLLYTTCERKGWAEDARPYNDLVSAWLSIEKQARADEGGQIEAEF